MVHDKANFGTVGEGKSFYNKYRLYRELLAKGSNPMVNTLEMKQIIKDAHSINPDRSIVGEIREEELSLALAMSEAPGGNWFSCLGIPSELPKEKINE